MEDDSKNSNSIQNEINNDKIDINLLQEQNYKYYLEFIKTEEINRILKNQLNNLQIEKNNLKQLIARLERKNKKLKTKKTENINDLYVNRKRHRRNKNEIAREFKCNLCEKKYGSEGSLKQHIRIKHKKENDNNL
jgi:hypothetical protein